MGSTWSRLAGATAVAALATVVACTLKDQAKPDFVGPSELGLSLELTANPDVLRWDGASQSLITVQARNSTGQPQANVAATVEVMSVDPNNPSTRVFYDLGTISARSIVTASDGTARITYTAPLLTGDSGEIPVWIVVTPSQSNAANQMPREVKIRLLPPGLILRPNGAPTADFNTSGLMVVQTPVTFDASPSKDPDGTIVKYEWQFGDGNSGSGRVVTHSYAVAGSYSVILTVTDDRGLSNPKTKSVTITDSAAPTAEFEFSPTSPQAGQTIYFNAWKSKPATGRTIVSYDWDFGSGRTASGITVEKRYDTAGTYKVTLTVTDDAGKKGVASKDVTVGSAGAVVADFTFSPTSPAVGQAVFFNAASSTTPAGTTITSYAWDFGDGGTGTSVTPSQSHTFAAAGTYVVRLTITNSAGQTATTTKNVTVSSGLVASFTISPTAGSVGTIINVNASASTAPPGRTIKGYEWNFGCDTSQCTSLTGTGVTSSTSYRSVGTYTITLTITDDQGNKATTSKTVTIS